MPLDGKHALITGSSRGIGRGIALKLAEHRVGIAVHYYQNERAANDTLAEVRKRGSDGFVVQADVSRPDEIKQMFRKVQTQFKKLDVFVSNARPEVRAFFQAPLGRHGLSQGGARVASALLRRGTRQTWHHGERDQPRLDREQRIEHAATSGPGSHQELARARLDAHGTFGNAGRCRQRSHALLFGASRLDHRTSDLRGWRCLVDESRGPPGDTTGIKARQEPATSRSSARPNKRLKLTAPVVYGTIAFVIIRPWRRSLGAIR